MVQGFRLLPRCLSKPFREYASDFRRDKSEKCTYEEVRVWPFSVHANFHVFEVHYQGTPTSVMKKTYICRKIWLRGKGFCMHLISSSLSTTHPEQAIYKALLEVLCLYIHS